MKQGRLESVPTQSKAIPRPPPLHLSQVFYKKKSFLENELTFFVLKDVGMFLGDEEAAVAVLFLLHSVERKKERKTNELKIMRETSSAATRNVLNL